MQRHKYFCVGLLIIWNHDVDKEIRALIRNYEVDKEIRALIRNYEVDKDIKAPDQEP